MSPRLTGKPGSIVLLYFSRKREEGTEWDIERSSDKSTTPDDPMRDGIIEQTP
jgi:hypothetical protein